MFEMEQLKYYTKATPKNIDQNTLFLTKCRPNITQTLPKLSYFSLFYLKTSHLTQVVPLTTYSTHL